VRVDSAIYFSNSNYVRERFVQIYTNTVRCMYSFIILIIKMSWGCVLHFRILRWLTDEEDKVNADGLPKINFLVVEMSRK